jgi:hypothetical protein
VQLGHADFRPGHHTRQKREKENQTNQPQLISQGDLSPKEIIFNYITDVIIVPRRDPVKIPGKKGRSDAEKEEVPMEIRTVKIDIPDGCNIILGQTHFIKTAEDLYEIIATTVPQAQFGVAFTEASGPCLIRTEGNDHELADTCAQYLREIGAGHVFCILLRNAFPINVLTPIKNCPEVCRIFCATANPLEVIVAATEQGKGILGVIDGFPPKGVETAGDKEQRKEFLRKIGYKL